MVAVGFQVTAATFPDPNQEDVSGLLVLSATSVPFSGDQELPSAFYTPCGTIRIYKASRTSVHPDSPLSLSYSMA